MERVFPHLLTFGIGGFTRQRRHRYSKRDIVLPYLDLPTNRFAEDPLFKLKLFDYLSMQRVQNGVFMTVKRSPETATQAMRVSPEKLGAASSARISKRKAAKSGRPVTQQTEVSRDSPSLLKSIYASTAKMWCSNQEREAFQRKVSAMTIMYGESSLFWTLTPNPDSSLAVAFWAGCDLQTGRPKDLVACTTMHMPSSAAMKRLTAQNTVLQAHYYKLCCNSLVEILFSWDLSVNRPKAEPGLFGFVEALFYALEQQGMLRVHHHGVLWVAGLPRTKGDWDVLLGNEVMRARFEEYCSSLFSAELPIFDLLESIEYPGSSCSGKLNPVKIDKKYKHRLQSQAPPPTVANCSVCLNEYTESAVVDAVLERAWTALDSDQQAVSTASAVREIGVRFGGLASNPATARVQLSRLLRQDQVHAYQHTHSCVKGKSGTKCRYKFFRDFEELTGLNEKGVMRYRRRVGNQWLNPFIPLWRRILHFNMDARMLGGGHGGLQATRYAIQYATKQQTVLDNAAVVELALRRRIEREATLAASKTELERGLGRLMSLAYSSSSAMEVGGPLVVATLLEDGAAKFSCEFERLVVIEALTLMDNEDINTSVVERGGNLFTDTSIRHYTTRPRCLESCCWYDFCAWYKQTRIRAPRPGDDCTLACDRLHAVLRQWLAPSVYTSDVASCFQFGCGRD